MYYRRDILKAALTAAVLPALNLPAYAGPSRRFIDIHCHFFNAADLPVRGFLERVVMNDYGAGQAQSAAGTPSQSVWKGLAAKLTDLILKYEAPTCQKELACLSGPGTCAGYASGTSGAGRTLKSASPDAPADGKAIADVLVRHYRARGPQLKSAAPGEQPLDSGKDTDAFVDFVLLEMQMAGAAAPDASSRVMKSLGSSLSDSATAVGNYLASGRSIFSRYFAWAGLLTNYRETIIETYYSLYDPQRTQAILTAPAIVDFNNWLQDQTPSPLKDQVELMSQLSLRQPRPMHGFIAFDPLREVRHKPDEPSPLAIVQDAVMKKGFLGTKLYSPMGFKPTGNAGATDFPSYAWKSEPGFGAKLDKALDTLYAWCEANDVPVMAHTTSSQGAGPGYAAKAEPKLWEKVLKKYPKPRLNLAHFGNFSQALNLPAPRRSTQKPGKAKSAATSGAAGSRTSTPISAISGGCWKAAPKRPTSKRSRRCSRSISRPIRIASGSCSAPTGTWPAGRRGGAVCGQCRGVLPRPRPERATARQFVLQERAALSGAQPARQGGSAA